MTAVSLLSDRDLRAAVSTIDSSIGDLETIAARAVWSGLAEPGDGVAGALIDALGPIEALRVVERALDGGRPAEVPGVAEDDLRTALRRWHPRLAAAPHAEAARRAARGGIAMITPEGDPWPERLADLGVHAPVALWVRGDVSTLGRLARSASLVGARAATPYGEHVSGHLAGDLAAQGVTIVSGGAYGIDGAAHRAALGAGGATIAIVAGGADRVYPAAHAHLFARIAEHGAIVSEVPPGTTPTKFRFLLRNRLIAAVSGATVVVEAGWRSGSLNTAGHAAALGRPLGAVPGPVTSAASEGCHRLLREYDAACVTAPGDVLEMLGDWRDGPPATPERQRPESLRVLDALSARSWRDLPDIARRSGLAFAEVGPELGLLELDGRVESSAAGWRLAARR
ncbi:DNA-processing protein DprA [Microbacterium marinilacus]|uniref:DNA-processing protein DprA n=1 Tax=Microbacterium marinilacus TaxID=415209 RepID=A0ABP7B3U9_9MICO|nr:DNA-processing protein DprA [Microbacterium marinilacus]MBY0687973.1 DNA-processing protein DprA [Microbacterium marinilacus]